MKKSYAVVRKLSADELKLLLELFDYNDPNEMLVENRNNILSGKIDIFGLFVDDRLVGELRAAYVKEDERFAVKGRRAYIYAFRISEEFQGIGYGSFLIKSVISRLSEGGYTEFTIGVEDDNTTAMHIYKKLGFTEMICRILEEYQGDRYEYGLYLKRI